MVSVLCDTMVYSRKVSMFQRTQLPPPAGYKNESISHPFYFTQ